MIAMLPPFTSEGVLPPTADGAPYPGSRDEVETQFVIGLGNPPWRRALFDGWDLLRSSVAQLVPSARWWLWGSLITNVPEPLFGHRATLRAVVRVDIEALPRTAGGLALLVASIHSAETLHRVDASLAIGYPPHDPRSPDAVADLANWQHQAGRAIVDLQSREMIPAGFIEVQP